VSSPSAPTTIIFFLGWFVTEVEVDFAPGQTPAQIYRPDVAGWLRARLPEMPDEVPVRLRPDWVCEILSPSNARHDTIKKKRAYHRFQVPHYWLIDPVQETLTVHRWSADGYVEVLSAERGERVRAEPFDAILLQVGAFFGEDEEE
jgi:Uma2 family endonuclease